MLSRLADRKALEALSQAAAITRQSGSGMGSVAWFFNSGGPATARIFLKHTCAGVGPMMKKERAISVALSHAYCFG